MNLTRLLSTASALFLFACGGATTNPLNVGPQSDGGGGGAAADAGADAGCPSAKPHNVCYGCGDQIVDVVCVDGAWECPAPAPCPSGPLTCTGTEPSCSDCNGNPVGATCGLDNTWVCPSYNCPVELPDAGCGGAGCDAGGPFACGNLTCDPTKFYCDIIEGGPPPPPDAGTSIYASCQPIPIQCDPNALATCKCVQALQGPSPCSCKEAHGQVTITCQGQ